MSEGTGFGTTIDFATSGFTAKITGVRRRNAGREKVETTHMESTDGWETSIPSDIKRAGEFEIDFQFNPQTHPAPPIDEDPETITVTYPNGATAAFTGYMTDYEDEQPLDELMTGSATIVVSGSITHTPAA